MAWTEPKTWTSETLTANTLNREVRDNLIALKADIDVLKFPATETPGGYAAQDITATNYVNLAGNPITITTQGGDLMVGAHGIASVSTTPIVRLAILVNGLQKEICYNRSTVYVPFAGTVIFTNLVADTYQIYMQGRVDSSGKGRIAVTYFWAREVS